MKILKAITSYIIFKYIYISFFLFCFLSNIFKLSSNYCYNFIPYKFLNVTYFMKLKKKKIKCSELLFFFLQILTILKSEQEISSFIKKKINCVQISLFDELSNCILKQNNKLLFFFYIIVCI